MPFDKTSHLINNDSYATNAMAKFRPTKQFQSLQRLPNFTGISAETAGARGICMRDQESVVLDDPAV